MKQRLNQPKQKIIRVSGVAFNVTEVLNFKEEDFVAQHADRVFLEISSMEERINLLKQAYTLCAKEVNQQDNGNVEANAKPVGGPESAKRNKSDNGTNGRGNTQPKP